MSKGVYSETVRHGTKPNKRIFKQGKGNLM